MRTFKQYLSEKEENSVIGIHYAKNPNLNTLYGHMSGTGIKGAEQDRLSHTKDSRIKKRVYFYPSQGENLPQPEQGLGNHAYEAKLTNMLDASKNSPEVAKVTAKAKEYTAKGEHPSNAFESALLDLGHHGYHTQNMSVVLNKDVPVKYIGTTAGRKLVVPKTDTTPSKHSVFDVAPNKSGEHESSILKPEQISFFQKNKDSLKAAAPSVKMQYGRLSVHKDHIDDLKRELDKHPTNPL